MLAFAGSIFFIFGPLGPHTAPFAPQTRLTRFRTVKFRWLDLLSLISFLPFATSMEKFKEVSNSDFHVVHIIATFIL